MQYDNNKLINTSFMICNAHYSHLLCLYNNLYFVDKKAILLVLLFYCASIYTVLLPMYEVYL